jgi:hypothetical protein
VLFAWRWGPIALATILLAVAAPLRSPGRRALLAVALLLVLFVPTVTAWIGFEREEMAGFEPALAGIRPGASVLGLDYLRKSPRFRCDPYYQMFAYASVERGAAIQFSFAEVASSIVRYRAGAVDQPWTRELEVYPQLLAPGDYRHFDALLLHASPENAAELARGTGILGPVATSRQWQLLRVDRARAIELYHPLQSPSTAAEPAQ